jgi:hypothetical protein
MTQMMFSPMFPVAPPQGAAPGPRRIFWALIAGAALFCMSSLAALLVFLTPYHNLRERALAFDASPNCHALSSTATPSASATPCTIEWANVLNRYYTSSHSSRSSAYHYYLRIRGGYGAEHTVELVDNNVWWRTANGEAIKTQRSGGRLTAITLQRQAWRTDIRDHLHRDAIA